MFKQTLKRGAVESSSILYVIHFLYILECRVSRHRQLGLLTGQPDDPTMIFPHPRVIEAAFQ